jgi:hypothetical protein
LATGHTKTFVFPPEQLPAHHVWEPIIIDNTGEHANKMFPARQHTSSLQTLDVPLVSATAAGYISMHVQWTPQPMPIIQLEPPQIKSESGNMKFIYRTRWDMSVPYTLHIKPSSTTETSYNKFVVPYPQAKKITKDNKTFFTYIATPKLL